LFEKIGKLTQCRFDRNEFGQFLGSATVVYENVEDANKAIEEYNNAQLDDRVLTVEHDIKAIVRAPKL
jgi:RNA recognition motif-containing protein